MAPNSFTLVHDSGSYTIEGERAVVTAAALLLCNGKSEIHQGGHVVIPRVAEPLRWFRGVFSIDLNTYLNRHRGEIVAALQTIAPVEVSDIAVGDRLLQAANFLATTLPGHGSLISPKSPARRRPRA